MEDDQLLENEEQEEKQKNMEETFKLIEMKNEETR
jgi:hypothetical protein